jgi:hypothetical protein
LDPTEISHTISARGDDVEEVLVIPLKLNGVVSCLPTFKPFQEECDTCDRYELTFKSPEYDPSAKTFREQEVGMVDSWGRLNVSGDIHPKQHQVCTLRQKEFEIKKLVLDDSTLLAELDHNDNISYLNVSSVTATMQGNGKQMLQPWPRTGESGLKQPRGRVS